MLRCHVFVVILLLYVVMPFLAKTHLTYVSATKQIQLVDTLNCLNSFNTKSNLWQFPLLLIATSM